VASPILFPATICILISRNSSILFVVT